MSEKEQEEYTDELVTSHSDEMPELSQRRAGPLCAHSLEGPPSDDLKRLEQERQQQQNSRGGGPFAYRPRADEQVVDEYVYIPPADE